MLSKLKTLFKTKQPGFSLIEVLASILILTITITPVFYTFTYCSMVTVNSGRQTQAVLYAQGLMEWLRANPHCFGCAEGGYDANNLAQLGIFEPPPVGLVPSVIVAWEDQSLGLYRVTVSVQWHLKKVREVQLTTLVFSR